MRRMPKSSIKKLRWLEETKTTTAAAAATHERISALAALRRRHRQEQGLMLLRIGRDGCGVIIQL